MTAETTSLSGGLAIERLRSILAILRTPGVGCEWDLRQDHSSLAPYAIEEAYELADAIHRGNASDMRDELGDCLLQVVYHARLAEEAGRFGFNDVVRAICAKMLRRHPHIFPAEAGINADEPAPTWEAIKAQERGRGQGGVLAGVPVALPGLSRAVTLQRRAASVGFDWDDVALVLAKIREEVGEVEDVVDGDPADLRDEIGDLLFAVGNLARHVGVDPEAALRCANAKFERRFAHIERGLAARGSSPEEATLAEMEDLWSEAKCLERRGADVPEGG